MQPWQVEEADRHEENVLNKRDKKEKKSGDRKFKDAKTAALGDEAVHNLGMYINTTTNIAPVTCTRFEFRLHQLNLSQDSICFFRIPTDVWGLIW